MVFSLQKFRHYLLENPFIFYTDHQALKYLVNKPLHHGRICKWIFLFQEFEFELITQPGKENVGTDHLSRVKSGEDPKGINNDLPNAHLFRVEAIPSELEEIGQYLQEGNAPDHYLEKKKKILTIKAAPFTLINGNLYKIGLDDILH